jgi:hypothetical protein
MAEADFTRRQHGPGRAKPSVEPSKATAGRDSLRDRLKGLAYGEQEAMLRPQTGAMFTDASRTLGRSRGVKRAWDEEVDLIVETGLINCGAEGRAMQVATAAAMGKTPEAGMGSPVGQKRFRRLLLGNDEYLRKLAAAGTGSREWTLPEKVEMLQRARVKDFQGHHVSSVANAPELMSNPDDIKFVKKGPEHLREHGGDYRTRTEGALIDRRRAMLDKALKTPRE